MNEKKRYANAFLITLAVYGILFAAIFLSVNLITQPFSRPKENTLSLNRVALMTQEKHVVPQEESAKEKQTIQEKPKEVKKAQIPQAKKEVVPTPVPKKNAVLKEKTQEFETTKETQSKAQKELAQEIEKPQELEEKSNPKNYEEVYVNDNLEKIVKLIQAHVHYPKRAREMGISGEVLVRFTILKVGGIENLEALAGHMLLKKSALKAIEEASLSFPKVEKDLTINVPIEYTLVQQH